MIQGQNLHSSNKAVVSVGASLVLEAFLKLLACDLEIFDHGIDVV